MGIAEVADRVTNNHNMQIEVSLCAPFRTPKSGCSICADICPIVAIRISGNGVEIAGKCIDCGVCVSGCPNSVFRMKERNDEKIIEEIRATGKGQEAFRISCQRGDARADLSVPCLGRLTEAMFVEAIKTGISRIEILQPECRKCPNSKASSHIEGMISRALAIYEMVDAEKDKLIVKKIPLQPLLKEPGKSVSRRELLSAFRTKAVEVAAACLSEVGTEGEGKETFREVINKRPENFKRRLLIQALEGFPSLKEVHMPSADAMLAEIEVSSECTACGVCVTLCPTGALTQEWEEEKFCLSFKPSVCTNCRVCVEVCMPEAIWIKDSARLNYLMEDREIKVFEAKRKTCSVCRIDFVGAVKGLRPFGDSVAGADICPLCIDRHNKQMAIIQKRGFMRETGSPHDERRLK